MIIGARQGWIARMARRCQRLLYARDGRLSRELRAEPAGFGLGRLPVRLQPDAVTTSVCGFCSTGCGLRVHLKSGRAVGLTPADDYPVNRGAACPKGWEALAALDADGRATVPLVRDQHGRRQPVSWDAALGAMVARVRAIQARHGPESVAFLGTGQITTEELALLGALAKFGMGMRHGDGNTRQCMATAVAAYKESFGFDAPGYCYEDLEQSDCLVLVGSNLAIAHPILWQRVMRNPHRPEIIVIDPRYTETAASATLHVPLRPKSDLELFYGLARIMIEQGWVDRSFVELHTNGYDELAAHVRSYELNRVSDATGLPPQRIMELAERMARRDRVSYWWTMGINQSHQGVRSAQAIINLALLTGNVGRPGTGANSITGQCNAMGSRLFSNTTNLLGGRDFQEPADRAQVAAVLGLPQERVPRDRGWAYPEIVENILRGRIQGLWVIATNPVHSWINQNQLKDVFSRLKLLVVQDMYHDTETAQVADILLPAAGWGEKLGTFINSERRVGLVRPVRTAPGEALPDFEIFRRVAECWGVGDWIHKWRDPESAFRLLQELSRGQPCDLSGIEGYAHLERSGGIQWPYADPQRDAGTHRRLFADGQFYHADRRARLVVDAPRPMGELPSARYPLLLLTGRGSAAQWHTQTRTARSSVLRKLYPRELYVEINPADARRLRIQPNQRVRVESQRGEAAALACVTHAVQPGHVFMPMHYPAVNQLTRSEFDPHSRQPSYKACAVRVRREDDYPQ